MIQLNPLCGFSFRRLIGRTAIFFAIASLALAIPARTAHATEASDFVVEVIAGAGGIAGVPIGQYEKELVKQIVGEVADGKDPEVALKNAVLKPLLAGLPPELQSAATCIANQKPLADCAAQQFSQSPEAVQCAVKGTPLVTCLQEEAVRRLPQELRIAAECVANRAKIANCAKGQVREVIAKLENAARDQGDKAFKAAPSAIQNIMNIVNGYQQKDWGMVLQNGGATFAKAFIRVVLSKFLPPEVLGFAGPMIDTAVENRINLVGDLVRAAESLDPAAVTRVLFEGFLTFQFEMQCSLPIIPQAVRDAVCGPLGEVIRALGGVVGDVTSGVLAIIAGALKDPLGVPAAVVTMLIDPIDGKEKDCGSAEGYYARRFATCYPLAASQKLTNHAAFDELVVHLNGQCRQYFDRCFNSDKFGGICDPMRNRYKEDAQKMESAMRNAAAAYSRDLRGYIQSKGAGSCGAGFTDIEYEIFISRCGDALGKQMPLGIPVASNFSENPQNMNGPGNPAPNCTRRPDERNMLSGSADSVGQIACRQAVSQREFEQVAKQVCKEQVITLAPENIPPPNPTITFQPQHDTAISTVALPTPPPTTNNLRPQHNRAISIIEQGQPAPNVNTVVGPARPIVPATTDVPRNNVPSGTAVTCPPGAVYFNGVCNSGGFDGTHLGGTSYDRSGRPITSPTPNPIPSGTAVARACPPDNPVGKYPNCCPRHMTPDGKDGCSAISTVQPGGTSYGPSGIPIPSPRRSNVPSGTPAQGGGNTVRLSPGNTTVGPIAKPAVTTVKPGIVPKEEPKKIKLRMRQTPPRESVVK